MESAYPSRIVCLTEETTETLYLLGEEERIVGISGFTVRPPRARREKPRVSAFTSAKIDRIVELKPEIAIIGSGATFRFPDPARLALLHQARIGVEVMDTQAACRTYNILLGEGRNVVAALIVP